MVFVDMWGPVERFLSLFFTLFYVRVDSALFSESTREPSLLRDSTHPVLDGCDLTVRGHGPARMAVEFLRRRQHKDGHEQRRQHPKRLVTVPDIKPSLSPRVQTHPTQPGTTRPRPSPEQALTTRYFLSSHRTQQRLGRIGAPQEDDEGEGEEEEEPSRLGPNRLRGGSEMQALWDREDPTVEDGSHGAQDSLQRLWGPLQVRPAVPGVPSGGEPDVRGGGPLELSQEGDGDEIIFWQGGDLRFYYY